MRYDTYSSISSFYYAHDYHVHLSSKTIHTKYLNVKNFQIHAVPIDS